VPSVRQTNFNAGELAPGFWGRTDLAKFATGMRRLRNFFVNKQGAAVSRPGTTYVGEAKFGTASAVRLIPFIYSDSQSYVLEFGENYIRFHTGGGTVLDGGLPYEVVTPYAAADVGRLQWAQTGDVLTLTHPSYAAQELRRLGHTDWTLSDVSYSPISAYFRDVDGGLFAITMRPYAVEPLPTADATHPLVEWNWKVTVVAQNTDTGEIVETLPADVTEKYDGASVGTASFLSPLVALYPDMPITLRRPLPAGPPPGMPSVWAHYRALAFNYYRGRGDLFGFVGQTKTRDFVDTGKEPDYSIQPPLGQNPFLVYNAASSGYLREEYPLSVVFFQERRIFLGTAGRPATFFASETGNYFNFDQYKGTPSAGDPLIYELATRKREDIRTALALDRLLVFTGSSVWSIAGQQGTPLDFDSVDARVVEEIGAAHLPALVVDGCALFVRAKGQGVRALVPGNSSAGYQGVDLAVLGQHLFLGKSVVDWCYQEDPFGLVWAVRNDGILLSLQFSAAESVWAWTRHDTDDAGFLACCAIPETDEDYVYLVVDRTIDGTPKRFIERMTSRVTKDSVDDDVCLDCATKFEGAPTATLGDLGYLEGRTVYATGKDLPVYGPFTVTDGVITLPEAPEANDGSNVALYVGLLFTPEAETLDVISTEARLRQKTVTRVGFEVDNSRGLYAGQDLGHLTEWRQRQVADEYGAVGAATELVRIAVKGRWDEGGRAALRQTLPLPVTILGITRELDFGG
jgi:hypothetical protein